MIILGIKTRVTSRDERSSNWEGECDALNFMSIL